MPDARSSSSRCNGVEVQMSSLSTSFLSTSEQSSSVENPDPLQGQQAPLCSCHCCMLNASRIIRELTRTRVLQWRLHPAYLACCILLACLTIFLLVFSLADIAGRRTWHHLSILYGWEAVLEVLVCLAFFAETMMSLRVMGARALLSTFWGLLDFTVTLFTIVSVCYGVVLLILGRTRGEATTTAGVAFSLLRLLVQPARVFVVVVGICKTRQVRQAVSETTVDFDLLHVP